VAIFEMLMLDESVRNVILDRKTSQKIRTIATESTGLKPLLEDETAMAAVGMTSVEELLRSLPVVQQARPLNKLGRPSGSQQ
jgi:type IV pilus assembly protein PilB